MYKLYGSWTILVLYCNKEKSPFTKGPTDKHPGNTSAAVISSRIVVRATADPMNSFPFFWQLQIQGVLFHIQSQTKGRGGVEPLPVGCSMDSSENLSCTLGTLKMFQLNQWALRNHSNFFFKVPWLITVISADVNPLGALHYTWPL